MVTPEDLIKEIKAKPGFITFTEAKRIRDFIKLTALMEENGIFVERKHLILIKRLSDIDPETKEYIPEEAVLLY